MSVEYRPAHEATRLAGDLIAQFHEHLIGVRIEYVFRSKAKKGSGKVVLGSARKITGLSAWLASPEWSELNERQRAALVDHELSHCFAERDDDGSFKLSMVPHDLEEFGAIVRRHGLWKSDVRAFVKIGAEQLASDGES